MHAGQKASFFRPARCHVYAPLEQECASPVPVEALAPYTHKPDKPRIRIRIRLMIIVGIRITVGRRIRKRAMIRVRLIIREVDKGKDIENNKDGGEDKEKDRDKDKDKKKDMDKDKYKAKVKDKDKDRDTDKENEKKRVRIVEVRMWIVIGSTIKTCIRISVRIKDKGVVLERMQRKKRDGGNGVGVWWCRRLWLWWQC